MKANQFVHNDDAVSPVIAVILMVAITVVLAATVYLWVSGFGSNQQQLVQASFGAKAVDVPGGDTDSSDDVIQITYVSGSEDLSTDDIRVSIDGVQLAGNATGHFIDGAAWAAQEWCSMSPGRDNDKTWERGASLYLVDTSATAADCYGFTASQLANIDGIHQLTVSVKGQVVLDTSIEVHDDAST